VRPVSRRQWRDLGDVLLSQLTVEAQKRQILVRARDADGILLRGSVFTWFENEEFRGRIDPSDGHTTLHPVLPSSIVEVAVTFSDKEQRRRLAVDQTLCEFDFPDVHVSVEGAAPAPGKPVPSPAESAPPAATGWRNSVVLAAAITAAGGVAVGYWQYFGPGASDREKVTLIVYVKDSESRSSVQNATVTLEGAGLQTLSLADSQGVASFPLTKGKGQVMTVIGRAPNYVDASQKVTATDAPVQLLLQAKPKQAVATGPVPAVKPAPLSFAGTWEIRIDGDLSLKRVQSGTVDFSALADGRWSVSTKFELDGATVAAAGTASQQGGRLFLAFKAERAGDSWSGDGQLTVAGSTLQGFFTDSKGRQLPVTLRRP
jgi:hypothetical protein